MAPAPFLRMQLIVSATHGDDPLWTSFGVRDGDGDRQRDGDGEGDRDRDRDREYDDEDSDDSGCVPISTEAKKFPACRNSRCIPRKEKLGYSCACDRDRDRDRDSQGDSHRDPSSSEQDDEDSQGDS